MPEKKWKILRPQDYYERWRRTAQLLVMVRLDMLSLKQAVLEHFCYLIDAPLLVRSLVDTATEPVHCHEAYDEVQPREFL